MLNQDSGVPPVSPSAMPVMESPAPEKRVWGGWATVGFGIVILIVFFVVQTIVVVIAGAVYAAPQLKGADIGNAVQVIMDALNNHLGFLQSLATIFSGIIGTGLILLFIRAKKNTTIKEYLGLNKISIRAALLSVGIIIVFEAVIIGLQTLVGTNAADEQITIDLYKTSLWPPLFWIAVVIFAPLFEEALFRGFLFEGFRQSRLGLWGAILITAVVWAILHSAQYHVFNVVVILAIGIVMGVMRWKTKTIWSTAIMHATMNLLAVITIAVTD